MNEAAISRTRTIEVAGAAIFGSGSAVVAFITAAYLPRVPGWGIALIDPVSILWVACYLMFGIRSGFLAAVVGTIALMPVDPFAPIGPIMKFAATAPMILIPTLVLKLTSRNSSRNSQRLSLRLTKPAVYAGLMVMATVVRDIVMIFFNILLFLTVFAPTFPYISLSVIGLGGITGWEAIIIMAAIINTEQSVWDVALPWLALRPTTLLGSYGTW